MIFIDSNVPMYIAGTSHPHKVDAQLLIERLIGAGKRLVTSAEVLQEVLHRYTSLQRKDDIAKALQTLLDVVDEVFPVEEKDVLRAHEILRLTTGLSARDALHIALMEHRGVQQIMTFDAGFDLWPGVERLYRA